MLQKKIIWKLNIIDLLIITIILLSILALIYKSVSGSGDESEYREYRLTYVCESAPIRLFDTIENGSLCIDGGTGDEVGELAGFEVTPIIEYAAPFSETSGPDAKDEVDENAEDENADSENLDENEDAENEDAENEDAENENNYEDEERKTRKSTPTPRPTPEPTRAKAVFSTTVDAAKAEHGIRINKNVYLIGQSMQLVIGNTVFDVYISDMQ